MNKQIVIIDDSQAILLVMKTMLAELGYEDIVTSHTPQKALDSIRRHPERYSIVFTDLNMPDVDGMQVIKELGEMKFTGGVCIISEMEDRVIELAADIARQKKVSLLGNLPKPIKLGELQRIMKRLSSHTYNKISLEKPMEKQELLECIEGQFITPYYQPKVDIRTNKVTGIEVLARVTKPGCTDAILPGKFLPTAAEHGLLNAITDQLFEKAFSDWPVIVKEFGNGIKLAVNLSPSQLLDPDYPDYLSRLISSKNINNSQIVLEITEELALENTEQLETLNRFRIRSFGLSLDDFGTGFTNLKQLRSLPFTEIKIDRSLVNDIHCDHFNQVVVNSLTQISKKLEVVLIAEGAESLEDFRYLETKYRDLHIQGFLICKPRPLDSLRHWHHSWERSHFH